MVVRDLGGTKSADEALYGDEAAYVIIDGENSSSAAAVATNEDILCCLRQRGRR